MNITRKIQEDRMRLAMENAKCAIDEGNSPFGAVVCDREGNVLAQAYNTTKTECDPTAHAEMKALRLAGKKLGTKDLTGCILVSNAQSCPMCFFGALWAGISDFWYGYNEDETLTVSLDVFTAVKYANRPVRIETGILREICKEQIQSARKRQEEMR